ncbi:MAG: STAS-like domain-containing protein, partial [Methylococcales symbiont of Iophon sp. n. MRB-2018]
TSWLEEVFGGLARSEGTQKVADTLVFISDEEPYLIDDIKSYIKDAEQQTH